MSVWEMILMNSVSGKTAWLHTKISIMLRAVYRSIKGDTTEVWDWF